MNSHTKELKKTYGENWDIKVNKTPLCMTTTVSFEAHKDNKMVLIEWSGTEDAWVFEVFISDAEDTVSYHNAWVGAVKRAINYL